MGIGVTVVVVVTPAAAAAVSSTAPWASMAIRVAGSWIAAIGLLMVGWSLRPGGLAMSGP